MGDRGPRLPARRDLRRAGDVLLALGIGQAARTLLGDALKDTGPMLHEAQLGPIRKDYPHLVLSAVLGGLVAGRAIQPRARPTCAARIPCPHGA